MKYLVLCLCLLPCLHRPKQICEPHSVMTEPTMQAAASALKFEVFRSKGQFYFRMRAANNKIILQSEGYHNKADALKTIELIRSGAAGATVVEK